MRWTLLLACLFLGPIPALGQDQEWTCVPGDQGRWRCGLGAQVPEAEPLSPLQPDRREPAPVRGPAPAMIPGVAPNPFGEPVPEFSSGATDQPSPLAGSHPRRHSVHASARASR